MLRKIVTVGLMLSAFCLRAGESVPLLQSIAANEPIVPIPVLHNQNMDEVRLGKRLFHDPQLSYNNTVSCASCHQLTNGGQNGLVVAIGVDGKKGQINTPTVLNSSLQFRQFWDGRVASLEEQVDFPVTNPVEMGSDWSQVIKKLSDDKTYTELFQDLYDGKITQETISSAIASYERALLTPNSAFDRYLKGEDTLSEKQKKGYRLFKEYGCIACHQGVAVGGNMYEKIGVFVDYFNDRGNLTKVDNGRFNVTGLEEHRFEFKVPSLRNIALTAPYFHDGTVPTLEEAVEIMAYYQLGRSIEHQERDAIVAFLQSLTGVLPEGLSND